MGAINGRTKGEKMKGRLGSLANPFVGRTPVNHRGRSRCTLKEKNNGGQVEKNSGTKHFTSQNEVE